MEKELRMKIVRASNEATDKLKKAGYSLQGRTRDLKTIAVLKDGEFYFFKDYPTAAKKLLK